MTKKSEESLLGLQSIVAIILILIGIGTVIYWGIAGVINVASRYSKFVKKVNNTHVGVIYIEDEVTSLHRRINSIENRLKFIDDRLYNLDKKGIAVDVDGTTKFLGTTTAFIKNDIQKEMDEMNESLNRARENSIKHCGMPVCIM